MSLAGIMSINRTESPCEEYHPTKRGIPCTPIAVAGQRRATLYGSRLGHVFVTVIWTAIRARFVTARLASSLLNLGKPWTRNIMEIDGPGDESSPTE